MNLQDAILKRRSIRVYNGEPINRDDIINMLNQAVYAPTHQHRQTWRFILIDGEAKNKLVEDLDQIFEGIPAEEAKLDYRKKVFSGATAILVVVNEKSSDDSIWTLEEYAAAVSMMQNFQLLAFEKNIGSCFKSRLITSQLIKYLGIKDNEMVTGALTMGYFNQELEAKERIKVETKLTIL